MPDVKLGTFQHFAAEIQATQKRKPRIYIAGPMAHLKQHNFPAFQRAQIFFERQGFEVLSPLAAGQGAMVSYNSKTWQGMTQSQQHAAFMEADRGLVQQADMAVGFEEGVFGSQGGWRKSRGAQQERKWTLEQDKPFHSLSSKGARMWAGGTSNVPKPARKFGGKSRALPRGVQGGHQKASVRYWLDLETQGLRTKAKSKIPGVPARRATDRLRMSQISFGREVKPGMIDFIYGSGDIKGTEAGKHRKVFTDIITEDLLKKSHTTPDNLLNDELLKRLTKQDMKGYWDVGVFVEGNPLREGLQRHVKHVLEGRKTHSERKVVEGIVDRMLEDVHQGRKVELAGWNIGFDWSRLQEAASNAPSVSRKLKQLRLHQNFSIKEAAEPVFEMTWNMMVHDRGFAPRFTDRAKLDQLVRDNKDVRGAIVEHSQLRSFMDVIAESDQSVRVGQFRKKFNAHLSYGESPAMADELADLMGSVRSYGEYSDVVQKLKGSENRYQALAQLFDRSYKPTTGRHVSLLGISGRAEDIMTTGFNFTMGWRQEQVVGALADLATDPGDQKMLKELIQAGLHDSDIDTMTSARISKMLRDIADAGPNSTQFTQFVNATMKNDEAMAAGFMEDIEAESYLKRLFSKTSAGPEDINLSQARSWFEKAGIKKGPFMAGAAIALGGLWLLGEHNRGEIEGVRRPDSQHNMIPGIDPTGIGSDFGSGRNVLSQLMGENYFSKAPRILGKSQEHIWEMTQWANALKPTEKTLRAVEQKALMAREGPGPWQLVAEKASLIDNSYDHMAMDQIGRKTVKFEVPDMDYRGVGQLHNDLAHEARLAVEGQMGRAQEEWATNYRMAQGATPVLEGARSINLVNSVPRRMPAQTHLQAGHAGYVQNLGRIARRSHIQDKYHRLGNVNPVGAQFKRYGPRRSAAKGARMEACA